jgi:hypothetical protein
LTKCAIDPNSLGKLDFAGKIVPPTRSLRRDRLLAATTLDAAHQVTA